MTSHKQLCIENNLAIRTVYRVSKRLNISFKEAVQIMLKKRKVFNKTIEDMDVNEYCKKYRYSPRTFYRYWKILNT